MKRLFLFAIVFCTCFTMIAQVQRNEVGFRATPSISVFGDFSHPTPGASVELFYAYELSPSFFFESGLKYSQISHEYLGPMRPPILFEKRIISEGFLEIPLILRLSLYESSNSRFNAGVLVGYSFGFKVNQFNIDVYSEEVRLKKVDWGESSDYLHLIQFGFNFSYQLKNNLKIGIRPQVRITQGFEWYQPANLLIPGVGLSISQAFGEKTEFKIKEE